MSRSKQSRKNRKKRKKQADKTVSERKIDLFDEADTIESQAVTLIEPCPAARDNTLLDHARAQWQLGDWRALAALVDSDLENSADRDRLALLAAAGQAQVGDMRQARAFGRRALDWGCPPELVARILISGVHTSLGYAATVLEDDTRAARAFEAAIATVNPREDTALLGRARHIQAKAHMGYLPEAAAMVRADHDAVMHELDPPRADILSTQLAMLNHEMQLLQKRHTTAEAQAASQLGQDLWVLEQTGFQKGGFFVEFGATDGIMLSNTYLLETRYGWQGICAEPNPAYFRHLRANRQCTVIDDCILGVSGQEVEFILADEYGGVAEFAAADKHSQRREAYRKAGKVMKMTSISLDEMLVREGAPRTIDYLSIDTEGTEYEILRHFPFEKWTVRFITVEHNFTEDRARINALLTGIGYRLTESQWDDWYALA